MKTDANLFFDIFLSQDLLWTLRATPENGRDQGGRTDVAQYSCASAARSGLPKAQIDWQVSIQIAGSVVSLMLLSLQSSFCTLTF